VNNRLDAILAFDMQTDRNPIKWKKTKASLLRSLYLVYIRAYA